MLRWIYGEKSMEREKNERKQKLEKTINETNKLNVNKFEKKWKLLVNGKDELIFRFFFCCESWGLSFCGAFVLWNGMADMWQQQKRNNMSRTYVLEPVKSTQNSFLCLISPLQCYSNRNCITVRKPCQCHIKWFGKRKKKYFLWNDCILGSNSLAFFKVSPKGMENSFSMEFNVFIYWNGIFRFWKKKFYSKCLAS